MQPLQRSRMHRTVGAETDSSILLARLCALGTALMLVILTMSATIRLGQAGCGTVLATEAVITIARQIHRISASAVGVVLLAVIFFSMKLRPMPLSRAGLLAILLSLTLFLAILGKSSSGTVIPAVVIGNVVAGVAMMALFWRLRLGFLSAPAHAAVGPQLRKLALLASGLTALQIVLGSWVAGIGTACGVARTGTQQSRWQDIAANFALNPLFPSVAVPEDFKWLASAHGISAGAVLIVVTALAISLLRSNRTLQGAGMHLVLFLALTAIFGLMPAILGASFWMGVVHNAFAAILMAALAGVQARLRRA